MLETGGFAGTIDPVSGAFQLTRDLGSCGIDQFYGQAAADGRSLTATFVHYEQLMFSCLVLTANVTAVRCGGGTLEAGEECDDGNVTPGDGCDASCEVEACFSCTGSPSTCAPLTNGVSCDDGEACTVSEVCQDGTCIGSALPDGNACSDSDICTLGDSCVSGVCTGTPLACGACGVCDGTTPACVPRPDGTSCDDGDGCSEGDTCQAGTCAAGSPVFCLPCYSCVGDGQCVATPRTGCLVSPSKSTLFMRNTSSYENDVITWRWRRGATGSLPPLGDPTQSTWYALCLYDETAPAPTLLFGAIAATGGCSNFYCWAPRRHGFSFRSDNGEGGFTRVDLLARPDGRVKISTTGKGFFVSQMPTPPLTLPLRAQLHAFDLGSNIQTCFEAEYSAAGVHVNDDGVFRARATGP